MPFYVAYSLKRRTITIKDVSPIQFVICETFGYIITIEAVLNDYVNHRNVTFDWVQLKGTAVVLSHPNEPITTFEYTDTSDKLFRFYIDKDTPKETYIDARVYHTPISFSNTGAASRTYNGTSILNITDRQPTSKTGYSRTIVTNVLGEPAVKFTIEYFIPAYLALLVDKLELFYSPDAFIAPYELLDTWTEDYPSTYVAVKGSYTWAISGTYISGQKFVYYSDIHISSPVPATATAGIHIIDDLAVMDMHRSDLLLTRFSIIKCATEINNEIGDNIGLVGDTNLIRFDNKSVSVLHELTNHNIIGYNADTINITKLNPSGIGSPA